MAAIAVAAGAASKALGVLTSGGGRLLARFGLSKHSGKLAGLLAKGSLKELPSPKRAARYAPWGSRMGRL